MYLKQIFLLQCILIPLLFAEKEPEPMFQYMNTQLVSIDEKLAQEWNNNETPKRKDYCRCDYDNCQCCEMYGKDEICLIMSGNTNEDRRGMWAIIKVKSVKIHRILIKNRQGSDITLDISKRIDYAVLSVRMYDFSLRDYDMLTFSVKIRIRIKRTTDYVCDLGTFTLMLPGASEDFLLPGPHSINVFPGPPIPPGPPGHPRPPGDDSYPGTGIIEEDRCLIVDCGRNNLNQDGRIHGGNVARLGELPWMVHFTYWDKIYFDCSGVVIDCYWILTTVHCTYYLKEHRIMNFNLTMGRIHLNKNDPKQKTRQFRHIIYHPDNNMSQHKNNIALVKLDKPIEFNDHIQPICLPTLNQNFEHYKCLISGWGRTEKGVLPKVLLKTETIIYSKEECQKSGPVILDTHICAGTDQKRADYGDNGGPLQCLISGQYYVAGLFTDDFFREGHRFRFEKVSSYIKFIYDTMAKY